MGNKNNYNFKIITMKKLIYLIALFIGLSTYSQSPINAPDEAVKQDNIVFVSANRDAKHLPLTDLSGWIRGINATENEVIKGSWLHQQDYDFHVEADEYIIENNYYNFHIEDDITIPNADATFDRIDVVVVNHIQTFSVIEGVPSLNVFPPSISNNQVALFFILVKAGSTEPESVDNILIYDENTGDPSEWNVNNPFSSIDVNYGLDANVGSISSYFDGTQGVDYFQADAITGLEASNIQNLTFDVKFITIPNSPQKFVSVGFRDTNLNVYDSYNLYTSDFGLDETDVDWQTVTIPAQWVSTGLIIADRFFLDIIRTDIEFIIDNVRVQLIEGISNPEEGVEHVTNTSELINDGEDGDPFITASSIVNTGLITNSPIVSAIIGGTTFDAIAGSGWIVDWTDPENPTQTYLTWPEFLGNALPDIATELFTIPYIIESSTAGIGELFLISGALATPQNRRQMIQLETVVHIGSTVSSVGTSSKPAYEIAEANLDYILDQGVRNSGNRVLENGANLQLDKTAGTSMLPFINRNNDPQNPTKKTNISQTGFTWTKSYQDGSGDFTFSEGHTTVEPDLWDDGSGTLATIGNPKPFTNKHFLFFGVNETFNMTYGQEEYSSIANAKIGLNTTPHNHSPILNSGRCTTVLIIKKGVTDIASAILAGDAEFVDCPSSGNSGSDADLGNYITSDTDQLSGLTGDKKLDGNWEFTNIITSPTVATADFDVPNRKYVDDNLENHVDDYADHVFGDEDNHNANDIINTPFGNLTSTDVQAALNELQTELDGGAGNYITTNTNQPTGNTGDKTIDGDWIFNTDVTAPDFIGDWNGLSASQFLRSDVESTKSSTLFFIDDARVIFGGGGDMQIYHNSANNTSTINLFNHDLKIFSAGSLRFTFGRTTGNFTTTGTTESTGFKITSKTDADMVLAGGGFKPLTDFEPFTTLTGTVINLSNTSGNLMNLSGANATASYALSNGVTGGNAILPISTTGNNVASFPTVAGADQWGGSAFETATNYQLEVWDLGALGVKYWFIRTDAETYDSPFARIDEGSGIGSIINGRNAANFGSVGLDAIDLSSSTGASSVFGATGTGAMAFGQDVIASDFVSMSFGNLIDNDGIGSFDAGINLQDDGYTNFLTGVGHDVTSMSVTSIGQGSLVVSEQILDWNATADKMLFQIGNGTIQNNDSDYTVLTRSNAFEVLFNGDVNMPSFGSGTKTGTATYSLAVDVNGRIIEEALGINYEYLTWGGRILSSDVNEWMSFDDDDGSQKSTMDRTNGTATNPTHRVQNRGMSDILPIGTLIESITISGYYNNSEITALDLYIVILGGDFVNGYTSPTATEVLDVTSLSGAGFVGTANEIASITIAINYTTTTEGYLTPYFKATGSTANRYLGSKITFKIQRP